MCGWTSILSNSQPATPRFNPISISGFTFSRLDGGAELAFTLLTASNTWIGRSAGLAVDEFAPRLSFSSTLTTTCSEVAKYRAARRLWSTIMRDRYGAKDDSLKLRFHARPPAVRSWQQPLQHRAHDAARHGRSVGRMPVAAHHPLDEAYAPSEHAVPWPCAHQSSTKAASRRSRSLRRQLLRGTARSTPKKAPATTFGKSTKWAA
jgi:hypothetical protein